MDFKTDKGVLWTAHQVIDPTQISTNASILEKTVVRDGELHATVRYGFKNVMALFDTYGGVLPETTFRVVNLYRSRDRGIACIHVVPTEPRPHLVGKICHITLWADGYPPADSNKLLMAMGVKPYVLPKES